MEIFKLEDVWICQLAYVHRKRPDDIMVLEEGNRSFVLIMKEITSSYHNIIPIMGNKEYISEQAVYFNLSGAEFYHGTQKEIFKPSDIGKIFVVERHEIPEKYLTPEEKESQTISSARIQTLSGQLRYYHFTV